MDRSVSAFFATSGSSALNAGGPGLSAAGSTWRRFYARCAGAAAYARHPTEGAIARLIEREGGQLTDSLERRIECRWPRL